jgi:hypothetical protein
VVLNGILITFDDEITDWVGDATSWTIFNGVTTQEGTDLIFSGNTVRVEFPSTTFPTDVWICSEPEMLVFENAVGWAAPFGN